MGFLTLNTNNYSYQSSIMFRDVPTAIDGLSTILLNVCKENVGKRRKYCF